MMTGHNGNTSNTTILVVDDAAQIREFVADYVLRPSGYHVLMADNGERGLELAEQNQPDLIVSDIKMPGMSGLELTRAVKARLPHTPIILITAEGSEQIAQQALRAGATDYFIKPFDPEEMLYAIQRALANKILGPASTRPVPITPPWAEIVEALDEGVLMVDAENKVIVMNRVARRAFGVESEELAGRPLSDVVKQPDLDAMLTNNAQASEITLEQERVWGAQLLPMAGNSRLTVLRDVTMFRNSRRARADFVATIAHDLRSPLTAILGYVSLIDRLGPLTEQQTGLVRQITGSVNTMSALLTDLLELSKLEAQEDVVLETVLVGNILHRVVDEYHFAAEAKQLTLKADLPSSVLPLEGHALRLRRMVGNLIENAIKYTPAGGTITISARAQEGFIEIVVADTGIGIPVTDQARIFARFFRAGNARELPGTGLGLSIVKSIVDQHNGRIWVESQPGHGTRFVILLPQRKTHQA
jgi:signal transduction histidine kinase